MLLILKLVAVMHKYGLYGSTVSPACDLCVDTCNSTSHFKISFMPLLSVNKHNILDISL